MTPNVNHGYTVLVIMMCPCRFINSSKCTTLVGDVDSRRKERREEEREGRKEGGKKDRRKEGRKEGRSRKGKSQTTRSLVEVGMRGQMALGRLWSCVLPAVWAC